MEVRKFKRQDLISVQKRTGQFASMAEARKFSRVYDKAEAYTALEDGVILGCAGIVERWSKVGEAFFHPTREAIKKIRTIVKMFDAFLQYVRARGTFRRIEANVIGADNARFAAFFGFTVDCKREFFTPDGSDCLLMKRLFRVRQCKQ